MSHWTFRLYSWNFDTTIGRTAGAQIIEKHFTISPKYRLSDNFSVTEDQVKKIKLDLEWAHHVTYSPSFNKSDPEKFMRNFKKIISHMFIAFRCTSGGNHGWGNINRLLLIYFFLKKKINFKYIFLVDCNKDVDHYLKKIHIRYININDKNKLKILKKIKKIDISIIELLKCNLSTQKLYRKYSTKCNSRWLQKKKYFDV